VLSVSEDAHLAFQNFVGALAAFAHTCDVGECRPVREQPLVLAVGLAMPTAGVVDGLVVCFVGAPSESWPLPHPRPARSFDDSEGAALLAGVDTSCNEVGEAFGLSSSVGGRFLASCCNGVVGARWSKPDQPEQAAANPAQHDVLNLWVRQVEASAKA
jgi:hypothetical protein